MARKPVDAFGRPVEQRTAVRPNTALHPGDRLVLRSTSGRPRDVAIEHNGTQVGAIGLRTIGAPTVAFLHVRAELADTKRLTLTLPDDGARLAWIDRGLPLRPARVRLATGERFALRTDARGGTLRQGRATLATMERRTTNGMRLLLTTLNEPPSASPELVLVTAMLAVFLGGSPKGRGGLIPGENVHKAPVTAAAHHGT